MLDSWMVRGLASLDGLHKRVYRLVERPQRCRKLRQSGRWRSGRSRFTVRHRRGHSSRRQTKRVLCRAGIMVSMLGEPSKEKAKEYGVRVAGYMAQPNADQLARIAQLVDAGKVHVTICRSFDLADAGKAQDCLENEHVVGKVVLNIG